MPRGYLKNINGVGLKQARGGSGRWHSKWKQHRGGSSRWNREPARYITYYRIYAGYYQKRKQDPVWDEDDLYDPYYDDDYYDNMGAEHSDDSMLADEEDCFHEEVSSRREENDVHAAHSDFEDNGEFQEEFSLEALETECPSPCQKTAPSSCCDSSGWSFLSSSSSSISSSFDDCSYVLVASEETSQEEDTTGCEVCSVQCSFRFAKTIEDSGP